MTTTKTLFEVTDNKGNSLGTVDRELEFYEPDGEVVVTLPCGHAERFWLSGLTNEEYVRRAEVLKAFNY